MCLKTKFMSSKSLAKNYPHEFIQIGIGEN